MIFCTMRVPLTQKCLSRYTSLPNCISRNLGQTEVLLSVYTFLMLFSVHIIAMAAIHLQTVVVFLSGMSFSSPFSIFSIAISRERFDIQLRIPMAIMRTIRRVFEHFYCYRNNEYIYIYTHGDTHSQLLENPTAENLFY